MTTASSTTYSKPPYKNYEEVFHPYPVQISSHNAFRAMEHDGKIFKLITHKIKGVKYIYWHADKNGIELWHKKNNVEAWVQTIHKLDERFVFAILRSGASLRTITEDPEENTECDPNDMLGVIQQKIPNMTLSKCANLLNLKYHMNPMRMWIHQISKRR